MRADSGNPVNHFAAALRNSLTGKSATRGRRGGKSAQKASSTGGTLRTPTPYPMPQPVPAPVGQRKPRRPKPADNTEYPP